MSGHSKWANIKIRKGAQDKKRSEAFTRLAKDILTAIRTGGGNTNPDYNSSLRVAIDRARAANMPKENIERLITKFEERKANLSEFVLEGYGPFGVPIIIEAESDNKNRILAEIKLILRNFDGSLAESGSVSFRFDRVGEIQFKEINDEGQLKLIDLGVLDLDENFAWIKMEKFSSILEKVKGIKEFEIESSALIYKTNAPVELNDESQVEKILELVEELESNDDVVGVYAGFDYN